MFCYSFWSVSPAQTIVHSWTLRELSGIAAQTGLLANAAPLHVDCGAGHAFLSAPRISARLFPVFYAGKRKDLLYQMVIIPLWVSYLVRAYAWKTILGSDGVLNTLLQYVHLTSHPA